MTNPAIDASDAGRTIAGPGRIAIDLGCGPKKAPGHVGLDIAPAPGVDHVVDFDRDPLPFADDTVSRVFSSHCFEHVADPLRLMREVSRIARHGAEVEIWVPYGFHNDAFLFEHRTFFNENHFRHLSELAPEFWRERLGAHWRVHEIVFAIDGTLLESLVARGEDLAFAVRHYQNVVVEMGVMATLDKRTVPATAVRPKRSYAVSRSPEGRRSLDDLPPPRMAQRARRVLAALTGR